MYLGRIRTIRPQFEGAQDQGIEWLIQAHLESERRKLHFLKRPFLRDQYSQQIRDFLHKYGCGSDKIAFRGTELEDFVHQDWGRMEIFRLYEDPFGSKMEKRMEFYRKRASKRVLDFYEDLPAQDNPPDHLVHVSCTGYVSPSPAQECVSVRGWGEKTRVTHAYHMGCYASLPAIRISKGLLGVSQSYSGAVFKDRGSPVVDVVHTEMCSLHMNPTNHSPVQLIAQSLFADGFAKYSLTDDQTLFHQGERYFKIETLKEVILPGTRKDMEWYLTDWGMQMTLAKTIPDTVSTQIYKFVESLLGQMSLCYQDVKKDLIFAIHPGGPKIVEKVAEALKLERYQYQSSVETLRKYGNMSSATLPHIWKSILEDPTIQSQTRIVSLAFGPGLTVTGACFEILAA